MSKPQSSGPELTAERLRSVLCYDPSTGLWTWVRPSGSKLKPGTPAGYVGQGRRRIAIGKIEYLASRLAVLFMTGEMPTTDVDHKDLNSENDRWNNLRVATRTQNIVNGRVRKNNKAGFKGVTRLKSGRYRASCTLNRCSYYLGVFDSPHEAHAAYMEAARGNHGEFARSC